MSPKIPQYQSQEPVTGEAPSRRVDSASYRQYGENIAMAGKAITEVNKKFEELNDTKQIMEARTEASERIYALQTQIDENPEYEGQEEFAREEITKIRKDTSDRISNNFVRIRYQEQFDLSGDARMFNIRKSLRKKQANATVAAYEQNKTAMIRDYYTQDDPLNKQIAIDNIRSGIDKLVSDGFMTKDKAIEEKAKVAEELRLGQVFYDIENDPEFTLQELEKGKKGVYENLTAEERLDFVKKVKQKIELNNKIKDQQRNVEYDENEVNLTNRILEGQATIEDINRARLLGEADMPGGVSKNFATAAEKMFTSPKTVTAKDDPEAYREISYAYAALGLDKEVDLGKLAIFRAKVTEIYAKGDLSAKTYKDWIDLTAVNYQKQIQPIMQTKFKQGKMAKGFFGISINSQRLGKEKQAEALMYLDKQLTKYLRKHNISDEQVPEVAQKIYKDYLRQEHPEILGFSEDGRLMVDADGNKAMVFPDGTIKELP